MLKAQSVKMVYKAFASWRRHGFRKRLLKFRTKIDRSIKVEFSTSAELLPNCLLATWLFLDYEVCL